MKVAFEASFARDLKKVRDKQLLKRVKQMIEAIKEEPSIENISSLKKLQGYKTFYRLRLGEYRIGIEVDDDLIIFVRFLHRRDVYRYFP